MSSAWLLVRATPPTALRLRTPRTSVVLRPSPRPAPRTMASTPTSDLYGSTFFLDGFAMRQWDDPTYSGTRLVGDKADFVQKVHAFHASGASPLVDGYAPFCKHIFVPNILGAKVGALEITDDNRHLLRSGYRARRPEELAVLSRWFDAADLGELPAAKMLDVILYSREQIIKEYAAMPAGDKGFGEDPPAPWGIISIKAQDEAFETPMQPITSLRNALGREEGGSGVPIDREAYNKAVQYWDKHAIIG